MDDVMNLNDFRRLGFLQEANRQFFHPLGLALGIRYSETEPIEPTGMFVYDWSDDPEGALFNSLNEDGDLERAQYVDYLYKEKAKVRLDRFDFVVQPIGHVYEEK